MKMSANTNVHVVSVNVATYVPTLRYVIEHLADRSSTPTEVTEIRVRKSNDYFDANENVRFDSIADFDSFNDFKQQGKKLKFQKYRHVISKLRAIRKADSPQLLLTPDYQVLYCWNLVRAFGGGGNVTTVYFQVELEEARLLSRLNRFMFRRVLRSAKNIDLGIFPEKNRLDYFVENSTLSADNTMVIPNTCNPPKNDCQSERHSVLERIPRDAFVVCHVGNLGTTNHSLDEFMRAIGLIDRNLDIYFLFLGQLTDEVRHLASNLDDPRVVFADPVPHQELRQIYPHVDLGVILYRDTSLNFRFCAPNKLYEFWSYGTPVIGDELPGLRSVFDDPIKGQLVDFRKPEQICDAIVQAYNSRNDQSRQSLQACFSQQLDVRYYLDRLTNRLDSQCCEE